MIVLEHTLIILLLLVSLLNARPNLPRLIRMAIWLGVALALAAPVQPLSLPWDWLAGLVIPLLIWHNAWNLVHARWVARFGDLLAWTGITIGIAAVLYFTAALPVTAGIVFGALVASMVWRVIEEESHPGYLGQLGPLILAFLLVEIAPAVEAPGRYGLALVAGSLVGIVIGFLAIQAALRMESKLWRNLLTIGQVYLAYATATLLDLSGVAAALVSVAAFVTYGIQRNLWPEGAVQPRPLNSPVIFILAILVLAFFGWQSHVPLSPLLLLEVVLGLLVTIVIIWVSRSTGRTAVLQEITSYRGLLRVAGLLTAALLLWPRQALVDSFPLVIAFGIAGLAIFGTYYSLTPLIHIYTWLDESDLGEIAAERAASLPRVEKFMVSEVKTVHSDASLQDVARALKEQAGGCVPVIDAEGRLLGVITSADLFVREEQMPMAEQTYLGLFGLPITPEELLDVYAQWGATRRASDVMTRQVVWVKPEHTIGRAVRLMVQMRTACLPVLSTDPEKGGKLAGLITRVDLIEKFMTASGVTSEGQGESPERNHFDT